MSKDKKPHTGIEVVDLGEIDTDNLDAIEDDDTRETAEITNGILMLCDGRDIHNAIASCGSAFGNLATGGNAQIRDDAVKMLDNIREWITRFDFDTRTSGSTH